MVLSKTLDEGANSRNNLYDLAIALRQRDYSFTTITPKSHAVVNSRPSNAWAQTLPDVFGWSRPFRDNLLSPEIFGMLQRSGAAIPVEGGWKSALRLSALGGQLIWHSAFPTMTADSVFFGPDTYRFASAIESFLSYSEHPVRRAVEICCGAGPGAITIATARPDASVFAGDINIAALKLTQVNALIAGVSLEVKHSDLLDAFEETFDLIVANPPYLVDPAKRAYRHGGGRLGSKLSEKIVEAALHRLAPGGSLLLYTGIAIEGGRDHFREYLTSLMHTEDRFSWSYREVDPDVFGEELLSEAYSRADRIAAVVLCVQNIGAI